MENSWFYRTICWMFMVLLSVSFIAPALGISADSSTTPEDCIACHADVWRDAQSKKFIHKPVRERDCKYCHVTSRSVADFKRAAYLDKVSWVARSSNLFREHWLEIDGSKQGATLLVEARSLGGRFAVKEFPLPALDALEQVPISDLKPVVITNVRLLEVSKGVFVSVVIGWDTDLYSDSQVIFGLDKLDQKTFVDTKYTKSHAVTLTGVKIGKTYKYKVISVDLAGNRSESKEQTLVADIMPEKKEVTAAEYDQNEPEVSVKYYRRGDKCVVLIDSKIKVAIALGILPKKYENGESGDEARVIRHLPLNSPEVTNIGVCYTCHVEYKKILTHPINVYPKRGMIIPPEYATLPDGRISCMSCHVMHASNVEFRLIKADRRELCRGCHKDIS